MRRITSYQLEINYLLIENCFLTLLLLDSFLSRLSMNIIKHILTRESLSQFYSSCLIDIESVRVFPEYSYPISSWCNDKVKRSVPVPLPGVLQIVPVSAVEKIAYVRSTS